MILNNLLKTERSHTYKYERYSMQTKQKRRNLHACHPIMKKGGVHEKSKSAKRAAIKRETRKKASEWLDRSSYSLSPLSVIVLSA